MAELPQKAKEIIERNLTILRMVPGFNDDIPGPEKVMGEFTVRTEVTLHVEGRERTKAEIQEMMVRRIYDYLCLGVVDCNRDGDADGCGFVPVYKGE